MKHNSDCSGPDFESRSEAANSPLPDDTEQQAKRGALLVGLGPADQAKPSVTLSDDARLPWIQSRLRFPAMGLCRR